MKKQRGIQVTGKIGELLKNNLRIEYKSRRIEEYVDNI